MKTIATLIAGAAALGLTGAAIAQTDGSMNTSNGMSGKSMKHSKMHKSKKHSSSMSNGSDMNGMRGSDMGAANGASPNGGEMAPTTPSNSMTPQ